MKQTHKKMIESGVLLNIQGNPIDKDGRFIVTKLYSALDITKDDFERPIRSIELPSLDNEVDKKVGGNGRNVIIKRSVFLKNNLSHPEIEISDNSQILDNALYRPNELINNKPNSKPNYWIVTKLSNKPVVANIDVDANKSHIELVGWRFISADDIARIERKAIKEGGQVLITNIGAADLSALQDGSVRKGTTSSATDQTNDTKKSLKRDEEYAQAVESGDVVKQSEFVKAAAKERDVRGNKTEDSALLGNEDQDKFVDYISRTRRNDYTSQNGEAESGLESILKYYQNNDGKDNSTTNARRLERISAISKEIRERKRRAAEIRQELGAKPNGEVQQREVERYFHKLRGKQIKTHFTDILKNISGQAECSQLLGLKQ